MSRPINILMVDDDEIDIMNMQRIFQRNQISHPLYFARNGEDALYQLKFSDIPKPHIILLDINMPKMDGFEFLSIIRADAYFNDVLVYVLTTSDEAIDRKRAQSLGVAGYLVKPLSGQDFSDQVDDLNNFWSFCKFSD